MHPEFDERLSKAAAPTTSADPWVRHELAALVDSTERASLTKRGSKRKWVIGGITAALVLGGATAAVAATVVPWGPVVKLANLTYEVTLASGNVCETRLIVLPNSVGSGTDNDLPSTVRADVTATKTLAAQIDVAALDIDAAREYLVDNDMVSAASSNDVIELQAYNQAVSDELTRRMVAEGVNQESISSSSETHCASDL